MDAKNSVQSIKSHSILTVYELKGYDDRADYLSKLSEDWGIELSQVQEIAYMLGAKEDFDGLLSILEGCRN